MTLAREPATSGTQLQRLADAWRAMAGEQRLATVASLGLFASMFLHWYSKTDTVVVHGAAKATETSLSAFQAFSFVEAAVLLVSAGVLAMVFGRAQGRAFQLPGGDGLVMMVAGGWTALLVFYRLLDKPGLQGNERVTATVGVEWGIFVTLLLALSLVYAGGRIRAGERPEPPLRRSRGGPRPHPPSDPSRAAGRTRAEYTPFEGEHDDPDLAMTVAEGPAARRRQMATRDRNAGGDRFSDPEPEPAGWRRPGEPGERATASDPVPAQGPAPTPARPRPRYPPAPHASSPEGEQLSFEDQPTRAE